MYHIVYLTRNLVNNKIYVGVHSTLNLNDGYLGSGDKLKLAFKKYGKENFKRDILYFAYDEEQMYEIESNIVDFYFISKSNVYNCGLGGKSGDVKFRKGKTLEELHGIEKAIKLKTDMSIRSTGTNNNLSKQKLLEKGFTENEIKEIHHTKSLKSAQTKKSLDENYNKGENNPNYGNIKVQGENNPNYGNYKKYIFISPTNEIYENMGIVKFCKLTGIKSGSIYSKLNIGKIKSRSKIINGWEFRRDE